MRIYAGWRCDDGCAVMRNIDGRWSALPLALNVCNHSPDGFNWGYMGSGPAQLALALAVDVMAERELAQRIHQRFKVLLMPQLGNEGWLLSELFMQRLLTQAAGELSDVPTAFLFARNLRAEKARLERLHGALMGRTDEEGRTLRTEKLKVNQEGFRQPRTGRTEGDALA